MQDTPAWPSTPSASRADRLELAAPSLRASYGVLSRRFSVHSPSEHVAAAVDFVYAEMRLGKQPSADFQGEARAALEVEIRPPAGDPGNLEVLFDAQRAFEAARLGDLLHHLDNELTMALEHALPSLYFVHAAVLGDGSSATLLVGDSGAGKSTTAYALAQSGCDYLSDELAPIDPATGNVLPYPRAICLKRDPPSPLSLPSRHLRTEWTLHVSPRDISSRVAERPLPLGRIIFVRYSTAHSTAVLRPLSRSEAAVRLYKCALNQLAHPSLGLDDTLGLIRRAECFELQAAGIEETVRAVRGVGLDADRHR